MSAPVREPMLDTYTQRTTFTLFSVPDWPAVDVSYTHVLVRLPDGYEFRLSAADAQRLGHALNNAGGGTLPRIPEGVR